MASYQEMSEFAYQNNFEYIEGNTETSFNIQDLIEDVFATQG